MNPQQARQRGFTLVELMTVVAMMAIVAGVAAPSFRSLIGTMRTKAAAFDLISDLTTARSEAIKRNTDVTISPVGSNWANGWQVAAAGTNLREHTALGSSISVSAPTAGVTFGPSGRLGAETNAANVSWSVTSTISGVTARCVVITPTGSARSKTGGC